MKIDKITKVPNREQYIKILPFLNKVYKNEYIRIVTDVGVDILVVNSIPKPDVEGKIRVSYRDNFFFRDYVNRETKEIDFWNIFKSESFTFKFIEREDDSIYKYGIFIYGSYVAYFIFPEE